MEALEALDVERFDVARWMLDVTLEVRMLEFGGWTVDVGRRTFEVAS